MKDRVNKHSSILAPKTKQVSAHDCYTLNILLKATLIQLFQNRNVLKDSGILRSFPRFCWLKCVGLVLVRLRPLAFKPVFSPVELSTLNFECSNSVVIKLCVATPRCVVSIFQRRRGIIWFCAIESRFYCVKRTLIVENRKDELQT